MTPLILYRSLLHIEVGHQRSNAKEHLNPGGGGGCSHMKQTGMLVASVKGVNFGFWSRLGCSGQRANILRRQGRV